ncbi:hypothetical protein EZS27_015511 [termite gut metagenome]|uniref:Uncharacterized protein n=1 Tax=termite gut metagenome TaxID=433724 RepID=A0A5J4RRG4_9ZZZZ
MSIKKNILKNGIANTIQKVVRVLEQLLLVPFFISSWGAAYYGEWLTLTIIPTILAFSDLGFGSAAANSFVLKYASGNKSEAANISKTGFIIISFAIIGGVLVGCIGLIIITQLDLLKNSLISNADAVWALSFLTVARLLVFYNQLFGAYFRAARRAALGINLLTVNGILNITVGFYVLFMGYGIVAFALFQLVVSILFNIFYGWKAISILGLNKEYSGCFSKPEVKDITSKGFGYLMSPIWQAILFQGTTLIVRLTLGPTFVTVFNTVRTLSRSVNQMGNVVSGSIFPELQYEIGAGRIDKAQKIFIYSMRIVLLFSVLGVVFLAIFGLSIYNIWTRNELHPPIMMWNIFLIGILFNAVWWTGSVIFQAVNRPYYFAITAIISATVAIVCSWFLCLWWGLIGAAISCLIFEILMALYVLPVSCKLIGGQPLRGIFDLKKK